MQNVKFSLKDKKRLIALHNDLTSRVLRIKPGQDNSLAKAACAVLTKEIKAINDKYTQRAQA